MKNSTFIRRLHLKNVLSFGSEGVDVELQPLNVIIGPNGSGKSNLVEILRFLRYLPSDITEPIRRGGGVEDWVWKGTNATDLADISAIIYPPSFFYSGASPLHYNMVFRSFYHRFMIVREAIEDVLQEEQQGDNVPYFYRSGNLNSYLGEDIGPMIRVSQTFDRPSLSASLPEYREIKKDEINLEQSILSQRRDYENYLVLSWLGMQFGRIGVFSELYVGQDSPVRKPQDPSLPNDVLREDVANLGVLLSDFERSPRIKDRILHYLKELNGDIVDYKVLIQAGTVQLHFVEKGLNQTISASRVSYGTLRFLCLLAILCNPDPPPLVCIEEPEIGLHPDVFPALAELLKEASEEMQIIVTTHANDFVSCFTDAPESVLICERDNQGSRFRRLEKEKLGKWLDEYSLGDLRRMGEIGGNRW